MSVECPECGRGALEVTHHDEFSSYTHEIDNSGTIPEVTDYCIVQDDEQEVGSE